MKQVYHLILVAAGGLLMLAGQGEAAEGSWSAVAGRPLRVEILSPVTEPLAFAAAELETYLERILAPAPATMENGSRIVLSQVVDRELGSEGFEIAAEGDTLHIRGGGDAGVVFGVYEFLRRYGGCRFSGLGPDGEHVPTLRTLTAEGLPLRMRPHFPYRGMQFSRRPDRDLAVVWVDWMAKNGFNYVKYAVGRGGLPWVKETLWPAMRQRAMKIDYGHHNLQLWLPPERYFEEHPEWFPMNAEGQRKASAHQLSFCTSHPEAVRTLIGNVLAFLREHPETSVVGVIPRDGRGMCHCERCMRMDAAQGFDPEEDAWPYWQRLASRVLIRRYTLLINEVARSVRAEFPEVRLATGAYLDLTPPDPDVMLESNVLTWVALYGRDGERPVSGDSPSETNRAFFEVVRHWQQIHPGKVITYSYPMGMNAQLSLPYPQDRVILREWRHFRDLGIDGFTLQCWPGNHEIYGLNLLAFARAAWHDVVDPEALLDEYLEGMYGSAAPALRPLFEAFHAAWQQAEEEGTRIRPTGRNIVRLLDAAGEELLDEGLRRARAAAVDDREQRQVERLAVALEYWRKAAAVWRLEERIQELERQGDRESATVLRKEATWGCDEILEYLPALAPGWGVAHLDYLWSRRREGFAPSP